MAQDDARPVLSPGDVLALWDNRLARPVDEAGYYRHCAGIARDLAETLQTLYDAAREAYHHFNADWIDYRKDGPYVRALGVALGLLEPGDGG